MKSVNRQILVPVDGSEYSTKALDVAIDLARGLGAEVVILHVVDLARVALMSGGQAQLIAGCLDALQSEGREIVEEGAHRVPPEVASSTRMTDGIAVEKIEQIAEEMKPSFIVMGTHGRSGLNRAIMGSVAEGVARRAPVPVVIVPPHRTKHTS
jgi:nucleotide-binding universal stress UspA family protein